MEQATRLLADVVAVVHLGFLGYVVAGGFFAWRRPRALAPHAVAVAWALAVVMVGPPCPLTDLQNWFRARGGLPPLRGGFVDTYLEGVLYPVRLTPVVQALVAITVAVSWYGCWRRRPRGRPRRPSHRALGSP